MENVLHKNIILFDGFCNLCNAAVVFVLKRDKKGYFSFASLQSETGKQLIGSYGFDVANGETIILIENNQLYTRTTAALRIARKLSGVWPILFLFIVVPKFIRDGVYNFIARNRYKWFGQRDTCALPLPGWKERFLEGGA